MDKTEPRNFRLDKKQIDAIKKSGLSLTDIVKKAVEKASKSKRCPTCGRSS